MSLRRAIRGVLFAALAPVGMAACGSSDSNSDTRAAATATPTPTPTAQPTAGDGPASLKIGQSRLGPPLMTAGHPRGQAGVKTRLIGSIHRTKPTGSQVTYNHHPLYLYIDDEQPGDVNGQGTYTYWYVLSPSGRPITKK